MGTAEDSTVPSPKKKKLKRKVKKTPPVVSAYDMGTARESAFGFETGFSAISAPETGFSAYDMGMARESEIEFGDNLMAKLHTKKPAKKQHAHNVYDQVGEGVP